VTLQAHRPSWLQTDFSTESVDSARIILSAVARISSSFLRIASPSPKPTCEQRRSHVQSRCMNRQQALSTIPRPNYDLPDITTDWESRPLRNISVTSHARLTSWRCQEGDFSRPEENFALARTHFLLGRRSFAPGLSGARPPDDGGHRGPDGRDTGAIRGRRPTEPRPRSGHRSMAEPSVGGGVTSRD